MSAPQTRINLGRCAGVVVVVLSACGGQVHASPPRHDAPSQSVYSPVQMVDGISIQVPNGWTLRRNPVPTLVEPSLHFEVGSWPLPSGGNGCAPSRAINAQPSTAALLWLYEYPPGQRSKHFPPQPHRFRLGQLGGPFECVGRRGYLILFCSHGRYFQVQVILGSHAHRLRRAVIDVLSSIRVRPAGQASP